MGTIISELTGQDKAWVEKEGATFVQMKRAARFVFGVSYGGDYKSNGLFCDVDL